MTRLLVSVTSAAEAIISRDNGADLIDVKDPSQGSLGAQSPNVWRDVLDAVGPRTPVSAALGELQDDNVFELARQTHGLAFAKVGLAGCENRKDWEQRWKEWRTALHGATTPVAVLYADWHSAKAISPASVVLQLVGNQRCSVVLIDTYDKQQGPLMQLLDFNFLDSVCRLIRQSGAQLVLAGSLQLRDLPQVLELQPEYVAVRGAVCRDSRMGPIDGALVREWSRALSEARDKHLPV